MKSRNKSVIKKIIKISKHKFNLEIYPRLVDWEIFPHNYEAALYAFSNKDKLNKIRENFLSASLNENETLEVIKKVYEKFSVVLDPHTAIGYGAFDKHNLKGNNIVLATAHPCKFPDAVSKAINLKSDLPKKLEFILNEKEDYDILENNLKKIKNYIVGKTK